MIDQLRSAVGNTSLPWPIHIRGTVPYMTLRPYTDKEWSTLPPVILTSDIDWYPTFLDCEGQLDNEEWFDAQ